MEAIDIGNSFSLVFDGKNTQAIRSVVSTAHSANNAKRGQGLITYNGSLYHCGSDAFKYDAYRLMANHDKQVDSSILDSVLLTLCLITPNRGKLPESTEIVVSVPDTFTSYQHNLVKTLNGVKSWVCDKSEQHTRIVVKNVHQEGFGSWYMMKRSNQLPSNGHSLVIDLGGGTALGAMIDNASGEIIKVHTYKRMGVVALAEAIQNNIDLRTRNDGDFISTEMIFKGIESGTYCLGSSGVSFKDFYELHRVEWWKQLFQGKIVSTFAPQFQRRDINKIIVTGGGAEVVRPFIEKAMSSEGIGKWFSVASNPLEDNVRGVYYYEQER